MEITTALQGTGGYQILIYNSSSIFYAHYVRPLFADKEKTMARQTTKKKIETPEGTSDNYMKIALDIVKDKCEGKDVQEIIKHEHGIDALRAELKRYKLAVSQDKEEIDRLNTILRQKDLTINALQKGNEKLSDELSKARNDC